MIIDNGLMSAQSPSIIPSSFSMGSVLPYESGKTYRIGRGGSSTTAAGVADRIILVPWAPSQDVTMSHLGVGITIGVASALMKTLVYASSPRTGKPTTKIYEGGNLDCSGTGSILEELANDISFKAGRLYWIGARASSIATYRALLTSDMPQYFITNLANAGGSTGIVRSLTYATAAPAEWVWSDGEASNIAGVAVGFTVA